MAEETRIRSNKNKQLEKSHPCNLEIKHIYSICYISLNRLYPHRIISGNRLKKISLFNTTGHNLWKKKIQHLSFTKNKRRQTASQPLNSAH